MKTEIYTTKRYVLSDEEEDILRKAAELFDELYLSCESGEEYESDFVRARDDIDYLINQLEKDDFGTFWKGNSSLISEL